MVRQSNEEACVVIVQLLMSLWVPESMTSSKPNNLPMSPITSFINIYILGLRLMNIVGTLSNHSC